MAFRGSREFLRARMREKLTLSSGIGDQCFARLGQRPAPGGWVRTSVRRITFAMGEPRAAPIKAPNFALAHAQLMGAAAG